MMLYGVDNEIQVSVYDESGTTLIKIFPSAAKCSRELRVSVKSIRNKLAGFTKNKTVFSPALNKTVTIKHR